MHKETHKLTYLQTLNFIFLKTYYYGRNLGNGWGKARLRPIGLLPLFLFPFYLFLPCLQSKQQAHVVVFYLQLGLFDPFCDPK